MADDAIHYDRFLLVKDGFYENPLEVYQAAREAEYFEPPDYTGFRSTMVYHPPGIKKKLEKILGIKIIRWDTDPDDENGIFYQAFSRGGKREQPGVHSDYFYNDITVLVYLTPGLPLDCGTSLWRHTRTGLCDPPVRADARRLNKKLRDLRTQLESDSKNRKRWIELDRVGYQFNRMVAYPSGVLHSATRHFGGTLHDVRLYQAFRIGVDWRTFRMGNSGAALVN